MQSPISRAPSAAPSSPTSAKHMAVSRRVGRIMDFDANEAMVEALLHTERACPELVRRPTATIAAARNNQDSSDDDDDGSVTALDYAALTGQPASCPPPLHTGGHIADATQFAVRQPLEGCVTSLHEEFLAKLREVRDHYRSVRTEVQDLEKDADELKVLAEAASRKADPLVAAVAVRREELKEVRNRQGQLNSLLREYRISDEEVAVLDGCVVDDTFLDTVDKVKRIHHSCRNLMLGAHQHAVVDVAESMYMTRLKATEVICQHLCSNLTPLLSLGAAGSSTSAPALPPILLRCLLGINDRPSHFGRVVGEIVNARRTVLAARYRELLHGVPGQARDSARKGPVPLESFATSDPLRFCTELLSWLHQRAAEEDDLLGQFYSDTNASPDGGAPIATKAEAVGDILDPLAQPIRSRLEQLTMSVAKQAEAALGPRGADTNVAATTTPSRGFSYGGAFSAAASLLFGGMGAGPNRGGPQSSSGGPLWSATAVSGIVSLFQVDAILAYYGEVHVAPLAGSSSNIVEGLSAAKLNCLMLSYNVLRVAVDSVSDPRTAASMVAAALPKTALDAQAIRGRWSHPPSGPAPTAPTSSTLLAASQQLNYPGCDLTPHPGVDALAQVVKGALEVVQGNQLLRTTEDKEREATPILGAVIDAVVGMVAPITRDPAALNLLPANIQVVELVKCVLRMNICTKFRALLVTYSFASRRTVQLSDELSEEVSTFAYLAGRLVDARLGLDDVVGALKDLPAGSEEGVVGPVVQKALTSIQQLHGMLQGLRGGSDDLLAPSSRMGDVHWLGPLTTCITSSQLREQAGGQVNTTVVHQYADTVKALEDLNSPNPLSQAALNQARTYPPEQVAVLLGASVDL